MFWISNVTQSARQQRPHSWGRQIIKFIQMFQRLLIRSWLHLINQMCPWACEVCDLSKLSFSSVGPLFSFFISAGADHIRYCNSYQLSRLVQLGGDCEIVLEGLNTPPGLCSPPDPPGWDGGYSLGFEDVSGSWDYRGIPAEVLFWPGAWETWIIVAIGLFSCLFYAVKSKWPGTAATQETDSLCFMAYLHPDSELVNCIWMEALVVLIHEECTLNKHFGV